MIRPISSTIRVLICLGILFTSFQYVGYSQQTSQEFLVTGKVITLKEKKRLEPRSLSKERPPEL